MSSLWTPSGEHPVDRPGRGPSPGRPPPGAPGEPEPSAEERAAAEEYARQVEAARAQVLAAPAGLVVGQQALQFYELAAMHLSQPEPRLDDARTAIDALAAVVERLGPRLGDAEPSLRQAVSELQMAFVEASRGRPAPAASGGPAQEPSGAG